jgi:hypothetical protein
MGLPITRVVNGMQLRKNKHFRNVELRSILIRHVKLHSE